MSTHALGLVPCFYSGTGVAIEHPDGGSCTCKPYRLTEPQWLFLKSAKRWTDMQGFDGTGARGARMRTASKLEGLGLVEYVGHGMCEDDSNGDDETPIYAITNRGRLLLGERPKETTDG